MREPLKLRSPGELPGGASNAWGRTTPVRGVPSSLPTTRLSRQSPSPAAASFTAHPARVADRGDLCAAAQPQARLCPSWRSAGQPCPCPPHRSWAGERGWPHSSFSAHLLLRLKPKHDTCFRNNDWGAQQKAPLPGASRQRPLNKGGWFALAGCSGPMPPQSARWNSLGAFRKAGQPMGTVYPSTA